MEEKKPPDGTPDFVTISACRSCAGNVLTQLFSIGNQFVSDFVPEDKIDQGIMCPIDIVRCDACGLVQAKHTARQDFLYTRKYWYKSSVTDTMRRALQDVAVQATARTNVQPGELILDIGSNDGTLLRCFGETAPGTIRVGIEPALNFKDEGVQGIDCLINDFWSADSYLDHWPLTNLLLRKGHLTSLGVNKRAKIITACGMLYDLDDPNQFISDVARVLRPDGLFVAQLMCLKQTFKQGDVGNFCHEHLEFYTIRSLEKLFAYHGLIILDVEENNVNGGSYRFYCGHAETRMRFPDGLGRYKQALESEADLDDPSICRLHYAKMFANAIEVHYLVQNVVKAGKRVWAFGASTKGNVLLQWWGLDLHLIEAAVDRSPDKHGLFTVGTGIPIKSEEEFRAAQPDYALVLPYAFTNEFVEREKAWRAAGGRFIVPLPELKIV